jgi:hypothetical protein
VWKQPEASANQMTPLATDSDRNDFITLTESESSFPKRHSRASTLKIEVLNLRTRIPGSTTKA